ncbi:MAG: response regulator [Oligoflexus sp.]|nr:response regulator [Oligoflexus sp.]
MERIHILLVEDEPDLAQALQDDLNEMGYSVFHALNGREALAFVKAQTVKVDIVLSDLNMPYMSGSQLIEELRKIGFSRPFIVLSGFGSRDELIQLLKHGAFNFLQKPVNFDGLKQAIDEASKYVRLLNESTKELKERISG